MSVARVTRKQCDYIFLAIDGLHFDLKKHLRLVHHLFELSGFAPGSNIIVDIGSSLKETLTFILGDFLLASTLSFG